MTTNTVHFNGGTITWAPINPYTNSSSIDITITQSYSWTYPTINCTTNVPVSSDRSDSNLTCIANCSTDGGYSNSPVDILTDCISYSSSLGMMSSQRSVNITLNIGAYFYIAYTGSAWRDLYSPSVTGLSWSIVALINLHVQDDGIINIPPVANIISPQYAIVNTTSLINIPITDVNEGDDIRCRWAINNVNLSINECSGICYPNGLPNDTILSNCTLSFTGFIASTWYAIALQVEDFINKTSTEPMSSIPVQFLIYVLPTPQCTILPVILSLTDCLEVQVSVTINFTLFVMNLCDSNVTITDIIITKGISGMAVGSLINSTTNTSLSYVPLSWTPQTNQIGSEELCVIAYNNLLLRSNQYCVTFTVTTSTPNCPVSTTTTTESPNKDKNSINIPSIIGLSFLALMLTLGCCCVWLYYLFCAAARGRRREKQERENIQKQKYPQLLPIIITQKFPFRSLNRTYIVQKICSAHPSEQTIRLSAQTSSSLSYVLKTRTPLETIENTPPKSSHHHQNNNIIKFSRNKISAIGNSTKNNDKQLKHRSNTILEDSDISIVQESRIIKVITPKSERQRRSRSNDASIDTQLTTTNEHSSRIDTVNVTKIKRLTATIQSKKSHEETEEHLDNKITVTSIPRRKSKTRSPYIKT